MFTLHPSRQEMYANDPKFLWKPTLRSLAIILSLTSIGLIGWSLTHQTIPYSNNPYNNATEVAIISDWSYDSEIWFLAWEFLTLGLSILWNVANILVLLLRNRPIHPGANVACDLLLWLGLIVTGIFATAAASQDFWWSPDSSYDNNDDDDDPSYYISANGTVGGYNYNYNYNTTFTPPCADCLAQQHSYISALNHKGVVIAVGAALGFVVLLMHFALFVSACRFTNARRVNAKAATIVAERMYGEKVDQEDGGRNPNNAFVPISEPLEQQAPLDYGMPPAPTGITVGEQGRRRAVVEEGERERERGTRNSSEQPEVVVEGGGGGEYADAGPAYGNEVHEA